MYEAESMASKAYELFRLTQLAVQRSEVLLVRAYARLRLEKADESMHDVETVLEEFPDNENAIHNKGILLLKKGEAKQAYECLERIQDPEVREDSLLPLADAYLKSGHATTAANLLRNSFSLDPPEWEDLMRAQSLLKAEIEAGIDDSVGPLIEDALCRHLNDPILFALSAIRSSFQGESEVAATALKEAINLSAGSFKRMLQSQLGHLYAYSGQNSEAAEQFIEVCGDDIAHPDAIPMLFSLSNSRQYRKALEVTKRFHEELDFTPREVLDVEVELLEYVGDVKAATTRLLELCSRTDASMDDWVRLAKTQFRCGEYACALKTIGNIDVLELKHNPQSVMDLAKLKRDLRIHDFINDAYLSYRFGFDNPNIQKEYFSLLLNSNEKAKEPHVVEPGCVVRFKVNEVERQWHIIECGESPANERELPPDNEISQHLLGRKVGDVFGFRRGSETVTCQIMELRSKYVYAAQEILKKFQDRFPNDSSLSPIEIDSNFTSIFRSVDARHYQVNEAERLYESQRLPFVSFCSFLGNSTIASWVEFTRQAGKTFWFGEGCPHEADKGRELLQDADKIVLDLIALLTVHKLELADYLWSQFSCVSIPQFVFEEIQREAFQAKVSMAPSGYFGKNIEGRYFFTEVPEVAREEWKQFVLSLFELAKAFKRIPAYPVLSADEPQTAFEVLGLPGAGTVYMGDEEHKVDSVLVSDDLVLSRLTRFQGITTVDSQTLLEYLLQSNAISKETYSSKVENLALMNYWFVRIGAGDILRSLESSSYLTTLGIQAMLRILRVHIALTTLLLRSPLTSSIMWREKQYLTTTLNYSWVRY